jgi:hypothetical protein
VSRSTAPSASEDASSLGASLRLENGHVKGTIVNRTGRPIHQLELVNGVGSFGNLADDLAAGASMQVDTQMNQGSSISSSLTGPADTSRQGERDTVLRLAASQVLGSPAGPGDMALVGLTSPTSSLAIDGQRPNRSALAALVQPVALQSADSLSTIRAKTRLVSTYSGDGSSGTAGLVDVYDQEIPAGITGALQLGYVYVNMANSPVDSVEVYDWTAHTWRPLPAQGPLYRGSQTAALNPGEVVGGVVRTRIDESSPYDSQLTLSGQ